MTRVQVMQALSGMRHWFDHQLETCDDEFLKSGKDVCTDAIRILKADAIVLMALEESLSIDEDEEDEDGYGGAKVDEYGQGHGAGDSGGCDGDPDNGRGGADRG